MERAAEERTGVRAARRATATVKAVEGMAKAAVATVAEAMVTVAGAKAKAVVATVVAVTERAAAAMEMVAEAKAVGVREEGMVATAVTAGSWGGTEATAAQRVGSPPGKTNPRTQTNDSRCRSTR